MELSTVKENNALTISVSGRIDTITAPELDKCIEENAQDVTQLVLDLKEVTYVSSSGLRVFLKAQKLMNKQGELKLRSVRKEVMEIIEITGFSDILTIED